jgi:hypothetical protein
MFNIVDADVHNSLIIRRTQGRCNPFPSLKFRKVLWDWTPPYAPLSRRGAYIEWWSLLVDLRTIWEDLAG